MLMPATAARVEGVSTGRSGDDELGNFAVAIDDELDQDLTAAAEAGAFGITDINCDGRRPVPWMR